MFDWSGLETVGQLSSESILPSRSVSAATRKGAEILSNTLGQVTSSIVGDSISGAGDWRKGLEELNYIKKSILEMEQDIKEGTISSAQLKYSGKIIDINADIYDQLATINEGIRDIQTFALQGNFPEMDEFELQEMLRQLEKEGYVKPIDLTEARR